MMRATILKALLLVVASAATPAENERGKTGRALIDGACGSPVAPGYLSAHGSTLVTQLGQYYRTYFSSIGGVATSAIRMPGCSSGDCSVPLSRLETLAHQLAQRGFVQHDWTSARDAPVELAPLGDPNWTHCRSKRSGGERRSGGGASSPTL
ncbi:MAG: hypothetical protein WB491_07245 [Candidatus Aquilonibacter sp.]